MSRDLNDRHRAGDLEIDVAAEPMELAELSIEDAEDMWLSVIALTPARMDYSRVQRAHLSHRALVILDIIRAHVAAGWPQIAAEHLTGDMATQVYERYWSAPALRKVVKIPLDLRSIPSRLRSFAPEDVPLEFAEETLIRAWHRAKYVALHEHVAKVARDKGVQEAEVVQSQIGARIAALTTGVRWRSFGDVALQLVDKFRDQIVNPASADTLIGTGFTAMDRMVRHWGPRKFTVVAGWNGHGKSTLIAQLLSQMAVTGVPGFYISGEDEMLITAERILLWLIDDLHTARRLATGQPQQPHMEGYSMQDIYALDELVKRVRDLPIQLLHLPNAPLGTVKSAIVDGARKGARVGAHDYLSTVEMPAGWYVTDWRNHSIRTLKAAFIENGLHGIEGAQLVRPGERDEKANRPTRYMIGNCPAAEECADYVILVHRKEKGKTTKQGGINVPLDVEKADLIVDKSKDGPVGVLEVVWCNTRHRFDARDENQLHIADRVYAPPAGGEHVDQDPF